MSDLNDDFNTPHNNTKPRTSERLKKKVQRKLVLDADDEAEAEAFPAASTLLEIAANGGPSAPPAGPTKQRNRRGTSGKERQAAYRKRMKALQAIQQGQQAEHSVLSFGSEPSLSAATGSGNPSPKKKGRTAKRGGEKTMHELSVTIARLKGDLTLEEVKAATDFLNSSADVKQYAAGYERGDVNFNRHLQCAVRVLASSPKQFRTELQKALGWGKGKDKDGTTHLHVKKLRGKGKNGKGHHDWLFMVGYCFKFRGQPGYEEYSKGLTEEEVQHGIDRHVLHGAETTKNTSLLSPHNIFQKATMFYMFKERAQAGGRSFLDIVESMLKTENYILASTWAK
jgi:hypothetical protein